MSATEGKRHVHSTFYAFANQQCQTRRKPTLSTIRPSPEVTGPGKEIDSKIVA